MNNILVVNINWLGDAVFSTTVFKALKENFPKARISCLCVPRIKKVMEHCPFIDEIIVFDEQKMHFWPWSKWSFILKLKEKRFDAAFLLHRSITRGLLVYLAAIPLRIGYCKAKWMLTHPVLFNDDGVHRADVYLKVLEDYGLKITDRAYQLNLKQKEAESLNQILKKKGIHEDDPIIVLHTAGNWDLKRWPSAYFSALIQTISQKLKAKVILSGAQSELKLCRDINEGALQKGIVLAGETTLGESLALFKRAQVVISSDSGPLHLAHSVGAKVIGIFGPTRPEITGPRGIGESKILFKEVGCNHAPCYHLGCLNNVCMQKITVNDVFEAIQKFTG